MRSFIAVLALVCCGLANAQAPLLPPLNYDASIPKPADVIGFEPGEWHVHPGQVVRYFEVLADASPRAKLITIGHSHEGRPLVHLMISSAQNLANLDQIAAQRSALYEDGSNSSDGPLIVNMGYSVHGNEASGLNAAPTVAYFLNAVNDPAWVEFLSDTIVIIDPSLNPDGGARFATWVNTNRSLTRVTDPQDRELREPWPGGRTNHYWFDLNRDWLLLSHPESRARIAQYHRFRPHVLTDFHEQGSNETYFFQPGVPSRTHPLTPAANQTLTKDIAEFHAKALDDRGELYYTEERFDDFYYGKGSSYPDINGSVGILFEQASARGHARDTINGVLTLRDALANHVTTSLSTFEALRDDSIRQRLKQHQVDFYQDSLRQAEDNDAGGLLIRAGGDLNLMSRLSDLLSRHQINHGVLSQDVNHDGQSYAAGDTLVVPYDQVQYQLIQALFERRRRFQDNTFYDVSTWSATDAFGMQHTELPRRQWARIEQQPVRQANVSQVDTRNGVGFVFETSDFAAYPLLQTLLQNQLRVRVFTRPLTALVDGEQQQWPAGTVFVPWGLQDSPDWRQRLAHVLSDNRVQLTRIDTALTPSGPDLGSNTVRPVTAVRPLLLVGGNVTNYEAGEVWHLFDQIIKAPLTKLDAERLDSVNLSGYTHIIMVNGAHRGLGEANTAKLKDWVNGGGILVSQKTAARWTEETLLSIQGQTTDRSIRQEQRKPYAQFDADVDRHRVSGASFRADLDLTHPLAFGYRNNTLPVFKNDEPVLRSNGNDYEVVAAYQSAPWIAGYVSPERLASFSGAPAVAANRLGQGLVVRFDFNPQFRGYWYATQRLILNAVYFGHTVDNRRLPGHHPDAR